MKLNIKTYKYNFIFCLWTSRLASRSKGKHRFGVYQDKSNGEYFTLRERERESKQQEVGEYGRMIGKSKAIGVTSSGEP
jgi:hypothetical protein